MSEVHPDARRGFSQAAQLYQRGRPDYPPAIAAWLRDAMRLHAGCTALDLGAGTGKFTQRLLETGAQVLAAEPVEAMLSELQRGGSQAQALVATAQRLPLQAGTVDAVTCAQSFHWFAGKAALDEIHRVLRPEGRLGLVWNVRDESVDWVAQLSAIMRPYESSIPRYHSGQWRACFEATRFSALTESQLAFEQVGSPEQVIVERVLSVSFIAVLPPEQRERVAAQLRALMATHPLLAGRDRVAFPYQTRAYCCTRLAD